MMKNNPLRLATYLALITALISGTNNFLTKIAVTAIKDPVFYTTLKNGIVAIALIGLIVGFRKYREIIALKGRHIFLLVLIGIIGGSIPFALFFTGLKMTTAINGGLIHKTLFLWVLLFAYPFLKERLSRMQWIGVTMVFAANFFIGGFTGFKFNIGEIMILAATILWAIENIIAKKVLADVSSMVVASARMVLGSIFLFIFLSIEGRVVPLASLTMAQWGWTLLTSGLLCGYVLAWYTALRHAPATYVATLLVPATLVTNVLSAIFVTHAFGWQQFASSILYIIGTILVIVYAKRTAETIAPELSPQPSLFASDQGK